MSILCYLNLHSWKCYKKAFFYKRNGFAKDGLKIAQRRKCERCGLHQEKSLFSSNWLDLTTP